MIEPQDISIPIEKVGNLPLRLDIAQVTSAQAADYFCHQYATQLNLQTEDDLKNTCVPPIANYIQNLFQTKSQPNIQQFVMKVEGSGEVDFSFDVNKDSAEFAADAVCMQKGGQFGLTTREQVVEQCIPAVSNFITTTLKQRNLV